MPFIHFIFRSLVVALVLSTGAFLFAQNGNYAIPATQSSATFFPKATPEPPQPDEELRNIQRGLNNAAPKRQQPAQMSFGDEVPQPKKITQNNSASAAALPSRLPERSSEHLPAPPKPVVQTAYNPNPSSASTRQMTSQVTEPEVQTNNTTNKFQLAPTGLNHATENNTENIENANLSGGTTRGNTAYDDTAQNDFAPTDKNDDSILDKPLKRIHPEDGSEDAAHSVSAANWKNKLAKPEWSKSIASVLSVGGALLVVLSVFFLLALLFKKVSPKSNRPLPKEAFEDLGRTYITQKNQLHLLRLGDRLILVSVTPDGVSPISEITDPDEVVKVLGLCQRANPSSPSALFDKAVKSISDEELTRVYQDRPAVSVNRKKAPTRSKLDLYSDPDESLAEMLARKRN